MPATLVPAVPAFDATGTPYSPEYSDVYHSADSGPGQARHVFLGGNDLPARWAGARVFTIVETGFGLGLNFLATWQAWRGDAARADSQETRDGRRAVARGAGSACFLTRFARERHDATAPRTSNPLLSGAQARVRACRTGRRAGGGVRGSPIQRVEKRLWQGMKAAAG
jgi:hypothetical protein